MKYVIFKHEDKNLDVTRLFPVVFPKEMTHSVIAMGIIFAYIREEKADLKLFSAGFCEIDEEGDYVAQKKSESLKIAPGTEEENARDSRYLNMPEAFNSIASTFDLIMPTLPKRSGR